MATTNNRDQEVLFYELLHAESEDEVTAVLTKRGLLKNAAGWLPLGDTENNWSVAGGQQAEAGPALAEKLINSIDAVLIYECRKRGLNPESSAEAPGSMEEAAEQFFGVKGGSLESIAENADAVRKLAERIQFVAVAKTKTNEPNYLVIDTGEGQSPAAFKDTFLSLAKSNKMRIPFVQGKYNAGGTGALRFCGHQNYQLIVSRRAPELREAGDTSAHQWGFTLIRRLRPLEGDMRRNSMYVYLAPDGAVPRFRADEVLVLPEAKASKTVPHAYVAPISHGTCLKLYGYKWKANGIATLEARFAINKVLYRPVLPIRITETRPGHTANYFSTTVKGGAIDDNPPLDLGPTSGSIPLPRGAGTLPVELKVFSNKIIKEDGEEVERKRRRYPTGVIYTLNGQQHGEVKESFISRKVGFDFLEDDLLLVVDITGMPASLREDTWMTSRDRVADTEDRRFIEQAIADWLREHQGLRDLNNKRKQEAVSKVIAEDEPLDILQELVNDDPALVEVFGVGDKLKRIVGPGILKDPYVGKRFPTFFRLKKLITVKECPINRACRLEFETDATNDYFSRGKDRGTMTVRPPFMAGGYNLFEGSCPVRLTLPFNAKVGDEYPISIEVMDPSRVDPIVVSLTIRVVARDVSTPPGERPPPRPPSGGSVDFPKINPVYRDKWATHKFDEYSGLRMTGGVNGDPLTAWVNMDNRYLHNEKARAKDDSDRKFMDYNYKYGLTILALGLIHEVMRKGGPNGAGDAPKPMAAADAAGLVNHYTGGLASVVIPVVRRLANTAAKAIKT